MIEIFIPVLFMCLNDNCNFMQSQSVFKSEVQCRISIDNQKIQMVKITNQAGQSKMTILEGTCINTKISSPGKQV